MVAYSFMRRFEAPIEAGTKTHTIRKPRRGVSRHARPGETLQLYMGLRTKHCRLIGTAKCLDVYRVVLQLSAGQITYLDDVSGLRLPAPRDLDRFAITDGFASWADLLQFWRLVHPDVDRFAGMLIEWGATFRRPVVSG